MIFYKDRLLTLFQGIEITAGADSLQFEFGNWGFSDHTCPAVTSAVKQADGGSA